MPRIAVALALVALASALLAQAIPARAADLAAEQQQIRKLDEAWVAAVATKDPRAIAAFYADDGALLAPGAAIAEGRDAILKAWSGFVGLTDFSLSFAPTTVQVAASADMAYEIGTYALSFEGDKGPVRDAGKFVVVWRKIGGTWKAAADIFNSDGAAP